MKNKNSSKSLLSRPYEHVVDKRKDPLAGQAAPFKKTHFTYPRNPLLGIWRWSEQQIPTEELGGKMDRGFTLIELLVVVLIIGILALANSTYATDFDELGIELAGNNMENPCTIATSGTPAGSIRGTKDYYLVLNVIPRYSWSEVIAVWKTGPYACAGFEYLLDGGLLEANAKHLFRCTEARHSGYNLQGKFCEKIEKGQATALSGSWQRYSLPN